MLQAITALEGEGEKYLKDYGEVRYKDIVTWLKSLKDRVGCEVNCTTTKEWSEEDEYYLLDVNTAVDDYFVEGFAEQYRDWLKLLKDREQPQNAWKPSHKQMEILSIYEDQNNSHGAVLTSLYQDLKKLKEK